MVFFSEFFRELLRFRIFLRFRHFPGDECGSAEIAIFFLGDERGTAFAAGFYFPYRCPAGFTELAAGLNRPVTGGAGMAGLIR